MACPNSIHPKWAVSIVRCSVAVLVAALLPTVPALATHETALGEIEDRPAPVFRRVCLAGTNAGALCKQDSECPGSSCAAKNIFNISVAFEYDAPTADIDAVKNLIIDMSAVLLDITDGQAEIGQATIHNNATSTTQADLRIFPSTNPVWWVASSGHFRTGGTIRVSINNLNSAVNQGAILAHEFVHLVFDARDEYETRPGCGNTTGNATCPDQAAINNGELTCLMDGNGTELCWGQGDPNNLTDVSGGNHDATNVTEQSECRSDRSCWAQVVHSWPSTFLMSGGAPDPGTSGATVVEPRFIETNDTVRVVLVLDESGSMSLESPARMERLKVAANDFVSMAENGTEVGIVSYSTDALTTSGRVNVPITALTTNRSTWTNAINGMSPDNMTNIGDGLAAAKQMIVDAGGVTANTFVILMTDGLNNQPPPQSTAEADLDATVADLLASSIPVYVTCTGGDINLQSQCSEIAAGTGGFYVDSADAARLPEAFVDFHERLTGGEAIRSIEGYFSKIMSSTSLLEASVDMAAGEAVLVDEGSESVTFTLVWTEPSANAEMAVVDPNGNTHSALPMPQGRYVRVARPTPGDWRVRVDPRGDSDSPFVVRAFTRNRMNTLHGAVRHASIAPGGEIYIYAFPASFGGPITRRDQVIQARITAPDGTVESIELHDRGRDATGHGDDIPADGVFTGIYRNTSEEGSYTVHLAADIDGWELGHDAHEHDTGIRSPRFTRELRFSAAVEDPTLVKQDPEDGPIDKPGGTKCETWILWILILIVLLLILILVLIWRCCRRMIG